MRQEKISQETDIPKMVTLGEMDWSLVEHMAALPDRKYHSYPCPPFIVPLLSFLFLIPRLLPLSNLSPKAQL